MSMSRYLTDSEIRQMVVESDAEADRRSQKQFDAERLVKLQAYIDVHAVERCKRSDGESVTRATHAGELSSRTARGSGSNKVQIPPTARSRAPVAPPEETRGAKVSSIRSRAGESTNRAIHTMSQN